MRVFVAATSSETQYVSALTSCYEIARRDGDEIVIEHRTHGYVARVSLVDAFLAKPEFDAILLLDADQRHPLDLLERLRDAAEASDLDMVCAHYYRRGTNPVQSLCYALGDGTYPFLPLLDIPRTGLHEIGITGFGCVLIRRRVIAGVAAGLPRGESPVSIGPLPEETGGHHDIMGSDFRFFIRARRKGYRLWLLADVESAHGMTFWLNHKGAEKLLDYGKWAEAGLAILKERLALHGMSPEAFKQRLIILESIRQDLHAKFDVAKLSGDQDGINALSIALYEMGGKMKECQTWLEWAEAYPAIERPDQLPTTETMPPGEKFDNAAIAREQAHAERTQALVGLLPGIGDNLNGAGRSDA